jgi:hypothetical protein
MFFTIQGGVGAFPSDLQVVHLALERSLAEEIPWTLVPAEVGVVEDGPEHPHGWVLGDRIVAMAIGRREYVDQSEDPGAEIGYRIGRFRLEHRRVNDFFGFTPRLHRTLSVEFTLTLRDSSGRVLWLENFRAGHEDRIPLADREDVLVDGLSPALIEGERGGFGRALIATALVGGLIYLLYTGGK